MVRIVTGFLFIALTHSAAVADDPLRFRFTTGQTFTYNVRQTTTVTETSPDEKTGRPTTGTTTTALNLTRKWDVTAVDPDGTATLVMAITAVRQEITRPGPEDQDGKPTTDAVVIDSATADGQEQMAAYLNKPVVTVKLDPRGQLVEAKSVTGDGHRLSAELPFRVTLPATVPTANASWNRPFTITLDPPLGTGEKYDAVQTYTFQGMSQEYAVIGLTTTLKDPPTDPAGLPALVPLLWKGEAFVNPRTGQYAGAKLTAGHEVANHLGAGSKFVYKSEYAEGLAGK